jgi:hypothetical protein
MPKPNVKRHGLVVQKIKGAWDIKLRQKGIVPLVGVLDNSYFFLHHLVFFV